MSLNPPPAARLGDSITQVGTPSLLIDLDAFEHNLTQMVELARRSNVALRPHAKAHKSVAIASAQMAQGAIGICCQKLSEAYPFAAAGIRNILISNQFVGADKVAMAVELAAHADLSVCVDHPAQIAALGTAAMEAGVRIMVLPEVDIGQHRCGVASTDALLALVDDIARHNALSFVGIQAYHGGLQHVGQWLERQVLAMQAADAAATYVKALDARGIPCGIVTGSGTGTAEFDAASGVYTELQPGSYVFMDRHYGSLEWHSSVQLQHSLFIVSTIMSTTRQGRAVCDVGLKGLSVDSGMPVVQSLQHRPALNYLSANDEHGILEIVDGSSRDRLGEKIFLIPGHCDPTVNLYSQFVGFRGGIVEAIWPIDAQGLSR